MLKVTDKGRSYLKRAALDTSHNTLSETVLAAIADKGPVDEEELDGWFSKVGGASESIDKLVENGYATNR